MNLTNNPMFWDALKFTVVMVCLTVVLYHNASNFDKTELKTLSEFALPMLGVVAVERIVKKKQTNSSE